MRRRSGTNGSCGRPGELPSEWLSRSAESRRRASPVSYALMNLTICSATAREAAFEHVATHVGSNEAHCVEQHCADAALTESPSRLKA